MRLNPHVLWATLFIIFAVWFSWLFRYDQFDQSPWYFLDRWTGQLVLTGDKKLERFSLRHDPWEVVSEKRISAWENAPLVGTTPREMTDAEVFGNNADNPFADLIPSPPPGFVLERKK